MSSDGISHPAVEEFVRILGSVIDEERRPVALHEPWIGSDERDAVLRCLDSTFVSTAGPFTGEFEDLVSRFCGARHVVAMANGTSALHLALLAVGVQRDEEVVIPSLTFVATANAVSHCGATPFIIDVEDSHFGMCPRSLRDVLDSCERHADGRLVNPRTGRRIAAVLPMHTFGFPAKIMEIRSIADEFGVPVVEDAAESLGSWVGDRHTGRFGRVGILSFNGNKVITTGGGGAVVTDDDSLARTIRHLSTTAKLPHAWSFDHDAVAWNYRMPNLNAALGVGQMLGIESRLRLKRQLARRYSEAFKGSRYFDFIEEEVGTVSNYWLSTVRMKDRDRRLRDAILSAANGAGFGCRPAWTLMHRLPMYEGSPRSETPVSEDLEDRIINVPSSPQLIEQAGE